ncbi:NAD(+) synthase [Chryseolinea lacunae]|uniref:NAD(+) synthase n=1 Tax=Chryseolinea lacunae TaxID=2801331 RepID=UPI001F00CDA3|nr:NAD(+) synthase [Chryseolinea lacunae]
MKIGGATVNQIPFDWNHNTTNIIDAITEGIRQEVKILCLPELCITGYGCEDLFLSEWLSERAWQELLRIREHCQNITVSVGLPIRMNGITYNGACVISNKIIQGITLKQNLARDGVHYEPRWFNAWQKNETRDIVYGGEPITVGDLMYTIDGVRMGFEICEDAWRKHNRPGYRLYERGVDLILNPSASHYAMGKSLLREDEVVNEGSSKFNCVYVFANLLGNEAGRMIYDGDIIIGQKGKLVAVNKRLSYQPFNVLATEVNFQDPSKTEALISADIKERNEEVTQALSLALFDYVRKSKANGFVLSLSGGADSSICAVMVAEMVKRAVAELGWEKTKTILRLNPQTEHWKAAVGQILTCAYQGTRNSSTDTFEAAHTLALSVGAGFHRWDIDEEVSSYSQKIARAIGRELKWETDDITLQNIQARSRSPIIWMLANVKRAVLLTTSNRSEGDVGYATMDGDTSGSLAPIAGLSKIFILQWLRWAEEALQHEGLNPVNNLQPTAELRPLERQQTDESDLMPYRVLAEIEKHAIQDRKSPVQVFEAMRGDHEPETLKRHLKKFFTLWAANQWKRERLAPAFHLDDINVDPRSWCRFPILSSGFADELAQLNAL